MSGLVSIGRGNARWAHVGRVVIAATVAVASFFVLTGASSPPAGFLWLGNDHQTDTVLRMTTTGRVVLRLKVGNNTGIAIDPATGTLFLSSRSGPIQTRNLSTLRVTGRIPGGPANNYEDLAWDGTFLYRADYSGDRLVRITRATGAERTLISGLASPIGVAYDSSDRTLWVSSWGRGQLTHHDRDGKQLGEPVKLDLGARFRAGGVAYDPRTDTLWVGSDDRVFHIDKTGRILGFFNTPEFGNAPGQRFVDGLEFEVPPR